MLQKLSRIFGITGSSLAMLPYLLLIAHCVSVIISSKPNVNDFAGEGAGLAAAFILMYFAPALLSSAGLIASFFIRKKPVIAGMIMAASSGLNLISSPYYPAPPGLITAVKTLSALMLVSAGTLAVISRFAAGETPAVNKPQNKRTVQTAPVTYPVLRKLSSIIAIILSALHTLPWIVFSINNLLLEPWVFLIYLAAPLLVSAAGLWGSLILYKHPVPGAIMMLISGGLVYAVVSLYSSMLPYWWLGIPSLLIAAAGVLGLISTRKPSDNAPENEASDPSGRQMPLP